MAYYDIVAAPRERIGAIITAEVAGVTVFVRRPKSVASPNLPAMLVTVDAAPYEDEMDDFTKVTRMFHPTLLVASWGRGVEFEVEELCEPYFEAMSRAFVRRPSLELTRGDNDTALQHVQNARLVNDSGIVNISMGGLNYAGIVWDIEVVCYIKKDRP